MTSMDLRAEAFRLLGRLGMDLPKEDEAVILPFSSFVPITHKLLDRIEVLERLVSD